MHCSFFWWTRSVVSSLVALALGVAVAVPLAAEAADLVEIRPLAGTPLPSVEIVPVADVDVAIPSCRGVVWQRFDADSKSYVPISLKPCGAMSAASFLPEKGRRFTVDVDVLDGDVVRAVVVVGARCASGQVFSLSDCGSVVAVEGPTITVRGRKE